MSADWKTLYAAAQTFQHLAPWMWMRNSDFFGVRDPDSGTIGWCTVMGNGGEFFGLGVYRGARGFDVLRRTQSDPNAIEDFAPFGQDAMVLCFLNRNEVDGKQLERIRAVGLRPRGRNAWPVFESHEPGRPLSPLPEGEVDSCLDAVLQAIEVGRRAREEPAYVEPDNLGRLLVRVRSGEGGAWIDERMLEPEPTEAARVQIDEVAARRTYQDLRRVRAVIECDVFALDEVIDDGDELPYVPAGILVVDAETGSILQAGVGHPLERVEFVRRELLATFQQQGAVPSVVAVRKKEVESALAPLASSLGFELMRVDSLPMLQAARASLEEWTAARAPKRRKLPLKRR